MAYMGRVLTVDLSSSKIEAEQLADDVYRDYLGGQGLAARILYDRIPAGADPLGPDNILGMLPGLLTGTGSLFSGRWSVVGKSPLTGTWGDANCGGSFAPAIKRCGYDGIFFRGISDKPVYLYVAGGRAELRDASHLWGLDAVEAEQQLIEETRPTAKVALIGPAGENMSLIAGVCNDRGRIAARSGLGAVMGSKRLKAVVLDGHMRIPVHNRAEVKNLSKRCNRWVQFQPPFVKGFMTGLTGWLLGVLPAAMAIDGLLYKVILKKWGTAGMNQMSITMGDSPLKNWAGTPKDFGFKQMGPINPDRFTECEEVKYHCYSCPLGCGGICKMNGRYTETHKPEYETVLALGGLCMNEDLDSLFYLNELLNRGGMDSISAGATVAFAIECFEAGLLTMKDTDGLSLTWGNTDAIVTLVHKMIRRDGLGDLLADGSKAAAERIGRGAEKFAVHAGGQEPAMHDSRLDPGFGLHYSVEPTPGRHTLGSQLYYEMFKLWKWDRKLPKASMFYLKREKYRSDYDKARSAAAQSKFMNVVNSSGLCLFGAFLGVDRIPILEWLNAATGWQRTPEEYLQIGANIQTLKQSFNIKHGVDPWQNRISDRALGLPPLDDGPNAGRSVEVEKMMQDYWQEFGWDRTSGRPQGVQHGA